MRNFFVRRTFLVGILASLGMAGLISSAQVAITQRLPIQPCLESNAAEVKKLDITILCDAFLGTWARWSDLRGLLEPQEVMFNIDPTSKRVQSVVFPDGQQVYPNGTSGFGFGKLNYDVAPNYFDVSSFVGNLHESGLPINLQGWDNPVVSVGKVQFTLGLPKHPILAESLYTNLISDQIDTIYKAQNYSQTFRSREGGFRLNSYDLMQNLVVVDEPERVYALIRAESYSIGKSTKVENYVSSISSPVLEGGRLAFRIEFPKLELVSRYSDLKPSNPYQTGLGLAVLVRINTDISDPKRVFEIVDPRSVRIETPERLIAAKTTPSSFCESRGGIDLSLQGKWSGNFTTTNQQGQIQKGTISSSMNSDGLTQGKITNKILNLTADMIGTTCTNGSSLSSYDYRISPYTLTSKGKVTKQADGSLRGKTEEFENGRLIGKTEFVLRRK
jgi:hypothetical protein